MADFLVAVRGGHNKKSPGAKALLDEVIEDRLVTAAVIRYINQVPGYKAVDVTPGNLSVSADLAYGVQKANAMGANLFVSIHFNKAYSSYKGKIGSEVLVYSDGNKTIALRVQTKLVSTGLVGDSGKSRGVKVNPGLYELNSTNMTAMIVEVCFVEAIGDVSIYRNHGYDKIGELIAEGITNVDIKETTVVDAKTDYNEVYRVRKAWADSDGQKGAYGNLDNAKACAKANPGYKVYNKEGRVIYTNGVSTHSPANESLPDINYQVMINGTWLPYVKNHEDYAGLFGDNMSCLRTYLSRGSVKYRVHIIKGNKWLDWVVDANAKTGDNFAGIKDYPIDMVEMQLVGLPDYNIKYRVHTKERGWLPEVINLSDYAGIKGQAIDGIQARICKK